MLAFRSHAGEKHHGILIPRRMAGMVTAAAIAIPCLAQAQAPKTDTTRGLSIQYADGQVSPGQVRRTGGMWTGAFPRIPGADTSRNGLPLTTLDIKHLIDGSTVVVTVTLYYGGPGQHGVTVATVRLSDEKPTRSRSCAPTEWNRSPCRWSRLNR